MAKIKILDDQTINKIAAGEVIENPASVVKELVENSLDAGSTEITVEIKGGGRQLIRISDNGCGMAADDAILCLERHATSKIRNVEDIQDILTNGFRGEAIPSIASISKFTLLTTPQIEFQKNCNGTMIIVEGGRILSSAPAVRTPGTTIEVKELFFNVPVRRKFQKSPSYDTQEILKTLTILFLGNPGIKFELISDQKQILDTTSPPSEQSFLDKMRCRIENTLGKDYFNSLISLSLEDELFKLEGYIGLPVFSRNNRTGQYLFINQRAVQSSLISFAIREGYGTALPSNKYPIFVLHLKISGSLIDVNVHPQKKEVRLRQEQKIKEHIIAAVQSSIQNHGFVGEAQDSFTFSPPQSYEELQPLPAREIHEVKETYHAETTTNFFKPQYPKQNYGHFQNSIEPFQFIPKKQAPRILATFPGYFLVDILPFNAKSKSEGFCILDQKAALSRIYYEHLSSQAHERNDVQQLLIPIHLEFSTLDAAHLKECLDILNQMGINIAEFGDNTFIVNALPNLVKQGDLKSYIEAMLEDLREHQDARRLQREKEKQIALSACRHSAIATKRLSEEEAQSILSQLEKCETPSQCPLGRPTAAYLTLEDIAKLFRGSGV